jgi:dimethylhistidine N-methyltransferase
MVEFGSGASTKASILLRAAPHLVAYVPVDISTDMLREEAETLRQAFPELKVLPVDADFCRPFALPAEIAQLPRAGFFPGSTIGNFEPHEASTFLRNARRILGEGAVFIVGVDLVKDRAVLNAAYNDAQGVTAEFNLNLLARINRELGANFDLNSFEHHAFYNRERSRIEMHLASTRRQKARLLGGTIEFRAGETIHTENSYKYSLSSFQALARGSGWTVRAVWTDAQKYFAVLALASSASP